MTRNYEWHPYDCAYIEDNVVKLRKNQAVRVVRHRSEVLDIGHADQSLDLVDLSIISEGEEIICSGVPGSHITSYYGQTWYKVETEEGRQVGFRETLLSSISEGRLYSNGGIGCRHPVRPPSKGKIHLPNQ